MKPLFVTLNEGRPDVHWTKLLIYCGILLVATCVLSAGIWYLFTGTWSLGALIVGLIFGVTLVVRVVARAVTYQEKEVEAETTTLVS